MSDLIHQEIERRKSTLIGKNIDQISTVGPNTGDDRTDIVKVGIDLALWDIRAKAARKNVAELGSMLRLEFSTIRPRSRWTGGRRVYGL